MEYNIIHPGIGLIIWQSVLLLFLVLIIFLIIKIYKRKKVNLDVDSVPVDFVSLNTKNCSKDYLPVLPTNWISELHEKYEFTNIDEYPNEYTELCQKLCNDVYDKCKYWENGKTHSQFLNELTLEQRILISIINFEAQVNNGGVYQFLFNYSELSIIALEGMRKMKMEVLGSDYEKVLIEYSGKFNTIQELNDRFQNPDQKWIKRWNSFADGYKELKSTAVIENYFYDRNFKNDFQEKIKSYIHSNINRLAIIEGIE